MLVVGFFVKRDPAFSVNLKKSPLCFSFSNYKFHTLHQIFYLLLDFFEINVNFTSNLYLLHRKSEKKGMQLIFHEHQYRWLEKWKQLFFFFFMTRYLCKTSGFYHYFELRLSQLDIEIRHFTFEKSTR